MLPREPPMSGQLCVALCVTDGAGDGVAALLAEPALTAVALAPDDDDVAEDVCVVAALTRSSPSGQEQRIARRRMVTSMARSWPSTSALYSVPMSVMA